MIPGYRIDEKLAEGGMGVVYAATDETLDRRVAIKMIRPELGKKAEAPVTQESVARFLREAKAAAQIQSSHVARVLHFGQTGASDLYLILEFLDGITLQQLLRQERRLKPERAVKIARQVCRGLKAAHDLQIVHRDLKPSNIMLIDQDGDPEFAKILDFGVAKLLGEAESGVTQAGALVGTYTSMAPEQVQGGTIDARTDVYALGVLLFRMLTGRAPFEASDIALVLHHHVFKPPPRPSEVVLEQDIPPELDAIVLRCLEKDPDRRVASMGELDRLLGAALGFADTTGSFPRTDPGQVTALLAPPSGEADFTIEGPSSFLPGPSESGEVFASAASSDVSQTDPNAETLAFGAGVAADPPTPMTSGTGRPPAPLDAAAFAVPDTAAESSRPAWLLPAAAGVVLFVVVVAAAAFGFAASDTREEVAATPPPPSAGVASSTDSPSMAPTGGSEPAPTGGPVPGGASPDATASPNDDESAVERPPVAAGDDGNTRADKRKPRRVSERDADEGDGEAGDDAKKKSRRERRAGKADKSAKKTEALDDKKKGRPKAATADAEAKAPKPGFVRVRTQETE